MHHLLNNGAEVNQRDDKGMTPLHRAAYLAQYDGYLELYEYLLVSTCPSPASTCHIMRATYYSLAIFQKRILFMYQLGGDATQ